MRKAITILACVLFAVALLNRDAFKEDISNRTVVQGVGVDINDRGTYTVTLETINTENYSNSDGTASPVMNIRSFSGKTVYSAIKSAYSTFGKTPVMSQNRVIIIGEDLAKKGIISALDFFIRDAENYPSVLIATTPMSAEDFFKKATDDSSVISRDVENIILTADEDLTVTSLTLCELVNRSKDDLNAFYMPVVSTKEEDKKQIVVSKGTAIFKGNKLKETISEDETAYLNFLCNNATKGAVDLEIDGSPVAISIIKSNTVRKVKFDGENPTFDIKVNIKADLAEYDDKSNKTIAQKDIEKVKNGAKEKIELNLKNVCRKLYETEECDAIGLSRLIYIYYPEEYRKQKENLNEIMTNSQYNVEVDLKIRRIGQDYES